MYPVVLLHLFVLFAFYLRRCLLLFSVRLEQSALVRLLLCVVEPMQLTWICRNATRCRVSQVSPLEHPPMWRELSP